MKMNCPYCGKTIETDFEVAIGQHVVCPWCERKFSYGEPQRKPARIEVPKINDEDEQVRTNVRCSHCGAKFEIEKNAVGKLIKCKACEKSFVAGRKVERSKKDRPKETNELKRRDNQVTLFEKLKEGLPRIKTCFSRSACWVVNMWRDISKDRPLRIEISDDERSVEVASGEVGSPTCQVRHGRYPTLGSLLYRFPALMRLAFQEKIVVKCINCSAIDVVCVSGGDAERKTNITCDCGCQFEVGAGHFNYLSWIGGVLDKVRRKRDIDFENEKRKNLRDEFTKQLKIFEDDWLAYTDPKAETQIVRVKELTDRFYKKLSVANANKLYHAQHTNTRLMSMYASNDSVVQIISGVAAWASSGKDAECEYNAKDLQKMIERNEQAVDYFYALGEEFVGKDKDDARDARLLKRVGYAHESELPINVSTENVWAEEECVKEVDGFVREKLGRYGKAMSLMVVIPLVAVGVVVFLMQQDHVSCTDVFVALGFSFFIGLVIFLSWPVSTYEATSEEFDSVRTRSREHDCE